MSPALRKEETLGQHNTFENSFFPTRKDFKFTKHGQSHFGAPNGPLCCIGFNGQPRGPFSPKIGLVLLGNQRTLQGFFANPLLTAAAQWAFTADTGPASHPDFRIRKLWFKFSCFRVESQKSMGIMSCRWQQLGARYPIYSVIHGTHYRQPH